MKLLHQLWLIIGWNLILPQARRCVYLGHTLERFFLSKNVSFNENSFPFKHIINHTDSENFVMPHFPDYQDIDLSFLTSFSPLQNRLVKWGLHPFINYWKVSSLVDVGSSTHSLTSRLLNSCMGLYFLRIVQ